MSTLELLRLGAEIKFPSGFIMKGDPENRDIDCYTELAGERSFAGQYELDSKGVKGALKDAEQHKKHMEEIR